MDDGKIGAVNIGDFRRVINAFCISLSDEHFDHLLMKVTNHNGGNNESLGAVYNSHVWSHDND